MSGRETQRIVFWDIDGTLVESSLERLFLRYLLRNRYVHPFRLPANLALLALRLPPPHWYQMKALYILGQTPERVREWVDACFAEVIIHRIRPHATQTVAALRDSGARQILLSGTLQPLAERLASHLGLTDVIAGEPELTRGRYSGRLVRPHPRAEQKALQAESWLSQHNYLWEDSLAIANHADDRPLLESAARPIVAFPDSRLADYARERGWRVTVDLSELPTMFAEG
ncbi:MAG TPA: HAD-IB family phosphatase [candidate division Zixibacteria bacterium]|nr:HAD-IB family phosphatase [candidate division Zixibacteria bacterium]